MSGGASQEISLNEPGKSQVPRISNLTCGFFVTARSKSGHRHLRRCCGYEVARATGRAAEPEKDASREPNREPTEVRQKLKKLQAWLAAVECQWRGLAADVAVTVVVSSAIFWP
jgi:hypothetical protein